MFLALCREGCSRPHPSWQRPVVALGCIGCDGVYISSNDPRYYTVVMVSATNAYVTGARGACHRYHGSSDGHQSVSITYARNNAN